MRITDATSLGEKIRAARRARKISQAGLARMAGTTQPWISAVENGKKTAEVGRVLELLALLEVSLHALDAGEPLSMRALEAEGITSIGP